MTKQQAKLRDLNESRMKAQVETTTGTDSANLYAETGRISFRKRLLERKAIEVEAFRNRMDQYTKIEHKLDQVDVDSIIAEVDSFLANSYF